MTKYERCELSHNWDEIRPLLKDSAQITYETIRPILLFGVSPKERAEETGMSKSSIYYKANLFDVSGMVSLLPHTRRHLTYPNKISVLFHHLSGKLSSMLMQNIPN